MTETTSEKVLRLPELFSMITSHLTCTELVCAMSVCKDWKQAITQDPNAQQALFLRAAKPKEAFSVMDLKTTELTLATSEFAYKTDAVLPVVKLSPFIHFQPSAITGCSGDPEAFPLCSAYPLGLLLRHPQGLWREMFITQPPCKTLKIRMMQNAMSRKAWSPDGAALLTCTSADGVRMGMLMDRFQELELKLNSGVEICLMDVLALRQERSELPFGIECAGMIVSGKHSYWRR